MPLTLRVRSAAGMWRLTVPDATTTIQAVKAQIEKEKSIPVATQKLTKDPQGTQELDDGSPSTRPASARTGLYLSVRKGIVEPPRADAAAARAAAESAAAAGRNVLADGDNGMSAEDQAAIAAALAEDERRRRRVRRPTRRRAPRHWGGRRRASAGCWKG